MGIAVELNEAFDYAEKINVYNNGEAVVYSSEEKPFKEIVAGWKALIKDAHEMPAFGVSLNDETLKARNRGIWTEFEFGNIYESNGMPFQKLLISVKKDSYGFNIIRYNSNGGYDGRCFYYDLNGKNMSDFYDILVNL